MSKHMQQSSDVTAASERSDWGTPGKRSMTQSLAPRAVIHRRETPGGGVAEVANEAVARAADGVGEPLREDLRGRFESSLGTDLSAVRVHTGGASAAASAAVGARAYAVGSDIHFGANQYQPDDPFGMHLIAHEVAHTQQQAGGPAQRHHKLEVSSPGDAAEVAADRAADAMVAGQATRVGPAGVAVLHRQPVATCDQTPQLLKIMDGLTTIEEIRDLKYAIQDAELDDSGNTRRIVYQGLEYTVSLAGAETLHEEIAEKEASTTQVTPMDAGRSLEGRVEDAIKAKDYGRMMDLQAAIDHAIAFYAAEPSDTWLLDVESDEVRTTKDAALAAKKRLEQHIPRSIDEMTPDKVDLKSLNVGFQLAANRQIADGLGTGDSASSVWIGMTREQLGIRFNPPLKSALKINFGDVPTADVNSAALIFSTGKVVVDASGVTAGLVEDEVRVKLEAMLAGSGFEEPGYDPFADQWLTVRFDNLKASVMKSGGPAVANQATASDIKGTYLAAQVKLGAMEELDADKTGLLIDDGSMATISFASGGTVAGGDLATMGKVTVSTNGATLVKEGKPAVKLKKMSVGAGCAVKVEDYELLGEFKDLGDLESILRIFVGAAERSNGGMADGEALKSATADADPKLVKGVGRYKIEALLEKEIRKMVLANGDVEIDGKKLKDIMGL